MPSHNTHYKNVFLFTIIMSSVLLWGSVDIRALYLLLLTKGCFKKMDRFQSNIFHDGNVTITQKFTNCLMTYQAVNIWNTMPCPFKFHSLEVHGCRDIVISNWVHLFEMPCTVWEYYVRDNIACSSSYSAYKKVCRLRI